MNGDRDLLVRARAALLDALEALAEHRESVVVIGAQAIYLHTGEMVVALPATTKDSDLALDPRTLGSLPLVEEAMRAAGFELRADKPQPGTWLSRDGIPVDLMVPEALAGERGHRGARVPPHSKMAMRRATGLEAAVVDRGELWISSLEATDRRASKAWVASPAALMVSKLHKIAERETEPGRLVDKDAHDLYRLLAAVDLADLVAAFRRLNADPMAGEVTRSSLSALRRLFAIGPTAPGSMMAGRAEAGIGAPEVVSASVAALASDLLRAVDTDGAFR
ncbi:MAG: GSU2403 family nucleotidyltransferase fold protein [Thermoanaerobaculia bacterium]